MKSRVLERVFSMFLFDLDGTILDTTRPGFRQVNGVLNKIGLPAVEETFLKEIWGHPFAEIARLVCEKVGAAERTPDFLKIDPESPMNYVVDFDLLQILWDLAYAGHTLGLITSRREERLKLLDKSLGFNIDMFHYVVTPDNCQYVKPHPAVFNEIKKLDSFAGEIFYFGDTINFDLELVRRSGRPIEFIGVSSGINDKNDFFKNGVDQIVEEVSGLRQYLQDRFMKSRYEHEGSNNRLLVR